MFLTNHLNEILKTNFTSFHGVMILESRVGNFLTKSPYLKSRNSACTNSIQTTIASSHVLSCAINIILSCAFKIQHESMSAQAMLTYFVLREDFEGQFSSSSPENYFTGYNEASSKDQVTLKSSQILNITDHITDTMPCFSIKSL